MMCLWRRFATVVAISLAMSACSSGKESKPAGPAASSSAPLQASTRPAVSSQLPASTRPSEKKGDAERGKALVTEQQCARCHDGLAEVATIPNTSHCVNCHVDVMDGKYDHKPDHAKWKKNVAHLVAVPSLDAAGQRLDYRWMVDYLLAPHEVRPNLAYDMPRLDLTRAQAQDIATYLTSLAEQDTDEGDLTGADPAAGKKLLGEKGCGSCHTMSRTNAFDKSPGKRDARVAVMLAPDLVHARKRLRADAILTWLRDPAKMKPGTLMPKTPMTDVEAKNIAAYILQTKLAPETTREVPALPKALDREVKFSEVDEKIFAKICRHCHGSPDEGIGDGGPGNTGGFGFKPRGLELTSFKRVMAGYTDDEGERHSVFTKTKTGMPRIVASLMARHGEIAGQPDPEVRGMPLGLAPLPVEDIQLLVTWIAQGRKR